jgi:hypothetical protein
MPILYLLFILAQLINCEEVYVEVSVLVSGDYNVSDLYNNIYYPNSSNLQLANSTGNVDILNTSNLSNTSNFSNTSNALNLSNSNNPISPLIFIKNSLYRIISVSPILCVIGYDFNCFNDTNVTRVLDRTDPNPTPLPVGFIVGTCSAAIVVVILGVLFKSGFKKKPIPERRLIMPILIDWPPKNKKLITGHGTPTVVNYSYSPHPYA